MRLDKDIVEVLLTPEQIQKRVIELANKISNDYRNKEVTFISILKGSVIFLSDLLRNLKIPCSIDFIALSSYGTETESSGVVRHILDLRESPVGKHLLIVEDIIDTGYTMAYLWKNLLTRRPKSLKICIFLNKEVKRKIQVPISYCGFKIPDKFVVGYGLDYQEKYRYLPYIGVLDPRICSASLHRKCVK